MRLTQRMGRGLVSAVLIALTSIPAGFVAAPAVAAGAAPTPVDLSVAGPFTDTFRQSPTLNTAPLRGLNVGLAQRQQGSVRPVSWTRTSGRWDTIAQPDSSYAQVSTADQPNRLVFTTGVSALMLGAPVIADTDGTYTVSTVVDPSVGEHTGNDWASVVLSRSHRASGYVTNGDVDLGLTVGSSGRLALFHGGGGETPFWQGTVTPADRYAVSVRVSTGADKAITLTVNGTAFPITGPASVNRWPSSAFLYLGTYLSTSDRITTFGDGTDTGLNVSRIDASATAGAKPFVDTFDGAPAGSDNGLNDDLSARQPTLVSAGYAAVSGVKGLAATPSASSVRVNSQTAPNALSFPQGTAAVRLSKPATADLSGSYTVHARLTPAVGRTSGGDAATLLVSNASGSTGAVDAGDVALGLRVQADGSMKLYQAGRTLPLLTDTVPPGSGSYEVSLALTGGAARQATVTVNGSTLFAGQVPADLPRDGYVHLGSERATPGTVGAVDDLRVSMLGGLDYYGYFDVMDPDDPNYSVDHSAEVAPWTNLNNFIGQDLTDPRYAGFLDYCRPAACVIDVSRQVMLTGPVRPNPDAPAALAGLVSRIGSNLDKISAVYTLDEPYYQGFDATQVQTEANQVRDAFPGKMLAYTTDLYHLTSPVPSGVDLVGFDNYCAGRGTNAQKLAELQGALASPDQHLVLFPESVIPRVVGCGTATDSVLAANNAEYRAMAAQNPRVVYLENFRWINAQQATDMPLTTRRQQSIGAAVINATPAPAAAGVGVYRPGDRTVSENSHNDVLVGTSDTSQLVSGPDDVVLTGHWNGPGIDTVAVYRPGDQTFVLPNGDGTTSSYKFGNPGDRPIVGDWSGRGRTTIGVYRPGNQTFYLSDDNTSATYTVKYGSRNWTPLVGNWSGSGRTTIGAYDPDTQTFHLRDTNTPGTDDHRFTFGSPGDLPIKGDWDGAGIDTVGVYRPGDQTFYGSGKEGALTVYGTRFGNPGDRPLVGNWG
ncbi:M23 family metallopeptidase [Kitasatospora sp. Ki12]